MQIQILYGVSVKMNENLSEAIEASVFYCRKILDNSTSFECSVSMMPLREFHCCTYNFTVAMTTGDSFEHESIEDVTTDIGEAERIFNTLCQHNVYPCHLFDVISDLIA